MTPGEQHLRAVLDLLLQDLALHPFDAATLPWDKPLLVLRAAPLDQLRLLLDEIRRRSPGTPLHILSHARDREAIADMAPQAIFHAYPTPGRYRLEEIPAAVVQRLRASGFGTCVFLEPGTSAELFDEAARIFAAVGGEMVTFSPEGVFARPHDWGHRARAHTAFLGLVDWYQGRLGAPEA